MLPFTHTLFIPEYLPGSTTGKNVKVSNFGCKLPGEARRGVRVKKNVDKSHLSRFEVNVIKLLIITSI
jgi:hypothetical protein